MKHQGYYYCLRQASRAFTLVELLLVMGVMALMMALVAPITASLIDGNNLTRSGQLVTDQLRMARQLASSSNQTIEVRFIQVSGTAGFDAVQLWKTNPPGSATPVVAADRLVRLPAGTAISQDNGCLSKIISAGWVGQTMNFKKGDASVAVPYASFQIKPNGMVVPTQDMKTCYLTVVASRWADKAFNTAANSSVLTSGKINLANYVTVQINPYTGTSVIFRP